MRVALSEVVALDDTGNCNNTNETRVLVHKVVDYCKCAYVCVIQDLGYLFIVLFRYVFI